MFTVKRMLNALTLLTYKIHLIKNAFPFLVKENIRVFSTQQFLVITYQILMVFS